jgi:hypothetical protein
MRRDSEEIIITVEAIHLLKSHNNTEARSVPIS